jgi:hypothetical protein
MGKEVNNPSNAEDLHSVGKTNQMMTKPGFVSPGTPNAPLAGEADLVNPVMSKKASDFLKDNGNLIK